jgi:hypothetical protein
MVFKINNSNSFLMGIILIKLSSKRKPAGQGKNTAENS